MSYLNAANPAALQAYLQQSSNMVPPLPELSRIQAHASAEWRLKHLEERLKHAPIHGFAARRRGEFAEAQQRVAELRAQQQRLFLDQFARFPAVQSDPLAFPGSGEGAEAGAMAGTAEQDLADLGNAVGPKGDGVRGEGTGSCVQEGGVPAARAYASVLLSTYVPRCRSRYRSPPLPPCS